MGLVTRSPIDNVKPEVWPELARTSWAVSEDGWLKVDGHDVYWFSSKLESQIRGVPALALNAWTELPNGDLLQIALNGNASRIAICQFDFWQLVKSITFHETYMP
jgi:hypothetical protein